MNQDLTISILALWLATWVTPGQVVAQPAPVEIRLATILPQGLEQANKLVKLTQDWKQISGGTVNMTRSPSGPKDGESGIVKKLRSGNYQAAVLSTMGLMEIEPDVAALQMMPLVFQNWEEVDFIREKLRPELERKLAAKGFVTLFWADSGWVNYFSAREGFTPEDFRAMKLFTWAGESKQVEIMKSLRYHPVPLETDNLYSAFATQMVDAAPLSPSYALGVRIPSLAPFVLDVKWTPIVGAAVVKTETWNRIPEELRAKLLAVAASAGQDIRREGRKLHDESLEVLRKGPKTKVHELTPGEQKAWEELAREIAPRIRGNIVPAEIYDVVQKELADFRGRASSK